MRCGLHGEASELGPHLRALAINLSPQRRLSLMCCTWQDVQFGWLLAIKALFVPFLHESVVTNTTSRPGSRSIDRVERLMTTGTRQPSLRHFPGCQAQPSRALNEAHETVCSSTSHRHRLAIERLESSSTPTRRRLPTCYSRHCSLPDNRRFLREEFRLASPL